MILITGATGFIGRACAQAFIQRGATVRLAVRRLGHDMFPDGSRSAGDDTQVAVGDIGPDTDWRRAVRSADLVVHLAAQGYPRHRREVVTPERYWQVNVAGSEGLARAAAAAGVRRLLYCSSIKARLAAEPGMEAGDPYGASKRAAEEQLLALAAATGLEVVVLRPPLVYGPGVQGNFLRLLRWVDRGVPLPLAAIHNRRSLVSLANLVDCLWFCLHHPAAPGRVLEVSDGEDLATPELLRRLGAALGRPARLLPCPVPLLRLLGRLLGRDAEMERLCGSLVADTAGLRDDLGWRPPESLDDGLAATVSWYRRWRTRPTA